MYRDDAFKNENLGKLDKNDQPVKCRKQKLQLNGRMGLCNSLSSQARRENEGGN